MYIIGSGPSLEVFPFSYLINKTCILLNDTHRYTPAFLGPCVFANNKSFIKNSVQGIRIVKGRLRFDPGPEKDDNHVPWDHPELYVFSYREPPWDKTSHHNIESLWSEPDYFWSPVGGNVSHFAIQFALLAGAKSISLIGCDSIPLAGQEYVSTKEQRSHVKRKYDAYIVGTEILMQEAKNKFQVPIVSITPFAGLGNEVEKFRRMKEWKNG